MSFIPQKKLSLGDYINYSLVTLISLICLAPFLYVVSVSLTDPDVYIPFKFNIIPEKFSLDSYLYLLSTNSFLSALKNTVYITIVGTILNIVVTFTMAYGLSRKSLPGRTVILYAVIFTLVFNPGIVPNYLLVQGLGLINNHWSLILVALTNAWSLIIIKSFIEALPYELEEAARIDGCNDIGVFLRIIIPLSKPAIATFTLFFAVAHWNTYFNALIYLTDSSMWTLQVLIKTLVIDSGSNAIAQTGATGDQAALPQETIRMASIVLAILPILVVYPFLQKYFAKGVMLGSVKG